MPKVHYSPISDRWFAHVNGKARQHFLNSMRSLETAQASIPAVPLYGKEDWSVVTDFYKFAQSKGIVYPKWQLEYELSRESKFGNQGGHAPFKELQPDVEMYVTNCRECNAPVIPETIQKYRRLNCRKRTLHETLQNQVAEDKIQDKAASWSDFDLKKTDPIAQQHALAYARNGYWRDSWGYLFSYKKKNKNRIFVPVPFSVNILQAQFHDPMLRAIQQDLKLNLGKSEFSFFGDKASFGILFNTIMPEKKADFIKTEGLSSQDKIVYVVRDFYHMDTTQGPSQKAHHYVPKLAAAFGIKPGSQAYADLEEIILYSNRMPIATPIGMITNKDKGEGSGATVTNQGEGCSNEDFDFVFNERVLSSCKEADLKVKRIDSYGNGDDGASRYVIYDYNDDKLASFIDIVEEAADWTCSLFKFIKNEKWKISTEYGIYCQYEIYEDEKGELHADYPASLALNSGMHPMREISKEQWDSDFVDIRWMQILAPLSQRRDFSVLVEYVDNGLKRGLFGKSRADFDRILSKYERYRALQDSSHEYNIYNNSWEEDPLLNPVVKEIMKRRGFRSSKNS